MHTVRVSGCESLMVLKENVLVSYLTKFGANAIIGMDERRHEPPDSGGIFPGFVKKSPGGMESTKTAKNPGIFKKVEEKGKTTQGRLKKTEQ